MSERQEALRRVASLLREVNDGDYRQDVVAYLRVAINGCRVVCKCGIQDKPSDALAAFALVYWRAMRDRVSFEENEGGESRFAADPDTTDLAARIADCIESILPVASIFEKVAASPTTEKQEP